ncbi:MAG: ribonuclease [Planctomycetota bacterium]|jgi:ribonuclease HI
MVRQEADNAKRGKSLDLSVLRLARDILRAMNATQIVEIFTDGACSGNPGPGGWGYILRCDGVEREGSGGESRTTNNRMELLGAIEGLKSLDKPARVRLVSDSQYLVKGLNEWIDGWKRRGWRRKEGPVMNVELWQELDRLRAIHQIKAEWVRGHVGHAENERCDQLAVAVIDRFR